MKKRMKNESAITLVALVITIVILLILAGVAITALTQTNLFKNAKEAKQKTENAQNTENNILNSYENKIDDVLTGSREQITIDKDEYEKLKNINDYSKKEEIEIGKGINGKKLYRKVFELDSFNSFKANLDNPDIVSVKGFVKNNGNQKFNIPYMNNEYYVCCYYEQSTDNIILMCSGNDISKTYIIIEYTKTTD